MNVFDPEIVSGSIFRSIWKLTWPLVLLNLVNGMHSFVDHILIGQFVGGAENPGNAAVGVAWQVFLVVVVFIASLFHGMNVVISRYSGKQDRTNVSKAFYESFLAAVMILLMMAPIGYMISPRLLDFVEAEPAVQALALPYIRILFTCGAPLFLMFMLTGAFQASGDPRTPLKLGILTTVLNVVLSTILITGMGPFPKLGTTGAALGTVLAPLPSVGIALSIILRGKTIIQPPQRLTLVPDLEVLRSIARIGFPTGVQGVLLNIGGVFLFKYIGSLEHSSASQAAYTICYANLFSLVTWTSFGLRAAAGTVMGQNIGAGNPARGKQAVAIAAGIGVFWACLIGLVFWFAPKFLLGLFGATEEPIFGYGMSLLHYLAFSGVVLAATLAMTGGLQGAGETKLPMYIAFLSQIVILLGVCQYFKMAGTLTPSRIWLAILIAHTSRLILTALVFRTEKWTHTQVEFKH